ncbi:RNA polymerase sigma-70 factor [Mycobacterium sp. 21AC1]|uniref:RNA polymerase sigma-70 factor n=1 Tax=[Mycobacterium] appelbergii TaxID=2939269 RepID=UPI002938EE39|nr:RNA polymerase sigma-70 factor [Mycobacterium sp. 21AC1]MDV3130092.1 RNA polymerase sigma-70 factor [Mycobacterium sp. 21AC1]
MAEPDPASPDLADAVDVFTAVRSRLFGVAYRMLGSVAEAEDVVQDVWLRWQESDRDTVRDPVAFLVTATTRACLNVLQSARARRETYAGPWLPEPVDTSADPALGAERDEALHVATLMLMEKLAPPERAAYILREAFDYPYGLIAETIQVSDVNARQLVSRARRHLNVRRAAPASSAEQKRLLAAFIEAAQTGDMASLEELLAADVVSYTDGNGMRNAAPHPVAGSRNVARFVRAFRHRFWPDSVVSWITANGQPGALVSRGGTVVAFLTVAASSGGIDEVLWVLTPEKLTHIASLHQLAD